MSVHFEDNVIAHFHLNWLAPVKVRKMLVGGSKKMIVYDDMESTEKVKVYDKGISMNHDPERRERLLAGYRNGDMLAPNLDTSEALRLMASDFVGAMVNGKRPVSDAYSGYRVVRLLELAQRSMIQQGRPIELPAAKMPIMEKAASTAAQSPTNGHNITIPPIAVSDLDQATEAELSNVPLA